MYLVCSMALLRLQWQGRLGGARRGTPGLAAVALAGIVFSLWAIAGAGSRALLWGALLMAFGAPVYWAMRRRPRGRDRD
jgi:APA family basic amino acid/polyamine antiporter